MGNAEVARRFQHNVAQYLVRDYPSLRRGSGIPREHLQRARSRHAGDIHDDERALYLLATPEAEVLFTDRGIYWAILSGDVTPDSRAHGCTYDQIEELSVVPLRGLTDCGVKINGAEIWFNVSYSAPVVYLFSCLQDALGLDPEVPPDQFGRNRVQVVVGVALSMLILAGIVIFALWGGIPFLASLWERGPYSFGLAALGALTVLGGVGGVFSAAVPGSRTTEEKPNRLAMAVMGSVLLAAGVLFCRHGLVAELKSFSDFLLKTGVGEALAGLFFIAWAFAAVKTRPLLLFLLVPGGLVFIGMGTLKLVGI